MQGRSEYSNSFPVKDGGHPQLTKVWEKEVA